MASLDHDNEHDTQNIVTANSECDWDCWDTGDWGDMEQQSTTSLLSTNLPISLSPKSFNNHEQWTSLEEKPVKFSFLICLYKIISILKNIMNY
jgi:hypothetical protein